MKFTSSELVMITPSIEYDEPVPCPAPECVGAVLKIGRITSVGPNYRTIHFACDTCGRSGSWNPTADDPR